MTINNLQTEVKIPLATLIGLGNNNHDSSNKDLEEIFLNKKFFIRTATYHLTGRVEKVVGHFLILEDAAWIADSGYHFGNVIRTGKFGTNAEIEFVGTAIVNIDGCMDIFPWNFELPMQDKG